MDPFIAFLIQTLLGGAGQQGGLFSASQPGTINSFLNSLIAPAEQAQATPAPLQQGLPFYSDQFTPPSPPPAASPFDISKAALEGIILNPDGSFMIIDPETGRRLSPLDFGQQQYDAQQADINSAPIVDVPPDLLPPRDPPGVGFEDSYPLFPRSPDPNAVGNNLRNPFDYPKVESPSGVGIGVGKLSRGKERLSLEEFNSPLSPPSSDFFSNFLASGALTGGPRVSRGIANNPFPVGAFQTQNQSNAGFFFPNSPGFPGFF